MWEEGADLIGRERISPHKDVAGMDPSAKTITFLSDASDTYDVLISTLPYIKNR